MAGVKIASTPKFPHSSRPDREEEKAAVKIFTSPYAPYIPLLNGTTLGRKGSEISSTSFSFSISFFRESGVSPRKSFFHDEGILFAGNCGRRGQIAFRPLLSCEERENKTNLGGGEKTPSLPNSSFPLLFHFAQSCGAILIEWEECGRRVEKRNKTAARVRSLIAQELLSTLLFLNSILVPKMMMILYSYEVFKLLLQHFSSRMLVLEKQTPFLFSPPPLSPLIAN